MTLFDLTGKVAVVTGGNGGIGLGMARGLAGAGASIVVAGRDAAKSEAAAAELQGLCALSGGRSAFIPFDATSEESCRGLIARSAAQFGRVDILVNNAGINIRKRPEAMSTAEWQEVLMVNLTSAFLCSQAAHPEMKRVGGGKIISTGSMLSLFGMPFSPAYGASKGGIVQLTKSLATAWAVDNIQVNAILPGWIDTELTRNARIQVDGLHDRVLARTPAQRWGAPEDFAGIAVFLSSAASDFVTGAAIPVDGGFSVLG